MATLTLFLVVVMILALCSTIYFSINFRRKGPSSLISRSYMNLSMGILFLALAVHLYTFYLPILGKILTTLILIIGVVNIYYSMKLKLYIQTQNNHEQKNT